jgi:hypothetical protein
MLRLGVGTAFGFGCALVVKYGVFCPEVDEKLLPHFAKLPANVYKVEADKQMIALYWGEKGEASVLKDIDALLKALA